MYEEFYGLRKRPFLIPPDPEFLFWTEGHMLALTMLRHGLQSRAPFTVITGEVGAGKTTIVRELLREVPNDVRVGLISNMQAERGQLLDWIGMALGLPHEALDYVDMYRRFQDLVVGVYAEGGRVVLIVDEAQNLSITQLEELRMLSNINTEGDELLQIILVGQPQLRALLGKPEMIQFSQRISCDFHLDAMSVEDVCKYIQHRCEVAGAQWRIFTPWTSQLIHTATRGVPRLVNTLCDLCLIYGFASNSKVIEEELLREFLNSARVRGIYQQFADVPDVVNLARRA